MATICSLFGTVFQTGTLKTQELAQIRSGIDHKLESSQPRFVTVWCPLPRGFSSFLWRRVDRDSQHSRIVRVAAEVKGFGKVLQKAKKTAGKAEKSEEEAKMSQCPCGGGEEKKLYTECCARYHGGVIEPDAETLMKARFSAYALGVVQYVVKTTHSKNPDFEDVADFAADVKATCERLRFIKLEILEFQEVSGLEAYVSFIVTYTILKGGRGERKYLKEKSLFVKENDRWFYRDREALSQASEAAWMASTINNIVDPENARKAFNKGTTTYPGFVGSSSGGEPRAPRINVKNRSGAK